MSQPKGKLIKAPPGARERLGLKAPLFDDDAIARAQAALEDMSGEFAAWLEADLERLQKIRLEARAAGWRGRPLDALAGCAHDLKGLGATYGFPLVSDIASSLSNLLETDRETVAAAHPDLIDAHVDAIRAVVRQDARTSAHPLGRALLAALAERVAALDADHHAAPGLRAVGA